jgi:predicted phage-related endonuclease
MVLAQGNSDEVPFDNSLDTLMNEYATVKVLQEETAALVESKKQDIKEALGDRVLVDCTGFRLYYKPVESTRFKSSALKKENPDLYEKYAYKSVSRPFRIRSI